MTSTITVRHPGLESAGAVQQHSTAAPARSASSGRSRSAGPLRVALLDNTKVNAFELLEAVARRLQQQAPVEVRRWRKRHAGESGAVAIAEMMQWQPQLMLTGLGD